jgi:hypothetical protein
MCFFNELNKNIEDFIDKQSIKEDNIIDDIYNAESDINEIYYSNEKNFDEELELIFNKYFSKYDINMFQTFDILLINIYNSYILNKIKINEYYSSTYIIKNINIED